MCFSFQIARPGAVGLDADGCPGEASLEYFWGLKKPGADHDQALIKRYEQHYKKEFIKGG